MAIDKPPISEPFASDPTTQADGDLFEAPSFMVPGYTAPGGNPEIPALGHFNWLFWWAMQSGRYQQSRGLPEWDAAEDQYIAPAAVFHDGEAWILVGTATPGTEPPDDPTNWQPFGVAGGPEFGDGSDGDVTISASAGWAPLRNPYYRNLTIEATGLLHFDYPFLVRVKGLLWIKAGGVMRFGHLTELDGGDAAPSTGGAAGLGSNHYGNGTLGGGSNGGIGGQDGVSYAGANGDELGAFRLGGTGGVGGSEGIGGGTTQGGVSGSSSALDTSSVELLQMIVGGGRGVRRNASTAPKTGQSFLVMGGAGGGGGAGPGHLSPGGSVPAGGGGGAGGSVGIVVASRILVEANGAFYAPGGNGGNHSGGAGGGGGGGGGYIGIACRSFSGTTQTAAVCCPGGSAGGSSYSVAATVGTVGRLDLFTI